MTKKEIIIYNPRVFISSNFHDDPLTIPTRWVGWKAEVSDTNDAEDLPAIAHDLSLRFEREILDLLKLSAEKSTT